MNIANIITFGRLLSVPVFIWLLVRGSTEAAFWLFLLAALSDAADGIIARQFHLQTTLGEFLDPIADKTLLVSAYVVLGSMDLLPLWIVIPVVSRDALIVGGAILIEKLTRDLRMEPILISKANTVLQLLLVLAAMLPNVFASPTGPLIPMLSTIVLVSTAGFRRDLRVHLVDTRKDIRGKQA